MIELVITNKGEKGKEVITFLMPETAREMKLRQYIDFIKYYDKWIAIQKKHGIISFESILGLSNIIAKFFEVDINKIIGIEVEFEDIMNGVKILSDKNADRVDLNSKLMTIVCFIKNVIDNIKPSGLNGADHTFKYKDKVFEIPYFKANKYLKDKIRPSMPLGQIIEVHEVNRQFQEHQEAAQRQYLKNKRIELGDDDDDDDDEEVFVSKNKKKPEADLSGFVYDQEGNFMLERCLRTIAILANEANDKFPVENTSNYIAERMWFFIDIDLQAWVDIDFFLNCIGRELKMTSSSIISLTLSKELLSHTNNLN